MSPKLTTPLSILTLLVLAGCGGQSETETASGQATASSSMGGERRSISTSTAAEPVLGEAPQIGQKAFSVSPGAGSMRKQSALVVDGTPLVVDTMDRESVRRFYSQVYMEPKVEMGWTGSFATGTPGTINSEYQRSTIQRVNWFRAMAGVPASITLSATNSWKAQHAALMMSANNALSHTPPSSWKFYSAEGAEAAGASNLVLGANGPQAVDIYMKDFGEFNGPVGHRRWLLFPGTKSFGTGDVPAETVGGQKILGTNALWVTDVDYYGARPQVRDGFVAWPARGFVPYTTVYARWSFSYPAADFSQAQVVVTQNGAPVNIRKEAVSVGAGENTVVWQMPDIEPNGRHAQPEADMKYQVTVSNVIINNEVRSFAYDVIVMDPGPVLKGPYSAYTVSMWNSVLTLMDNTGREGTQTVKNPSRVDFEDLSLAFDIEGNAGKAYRLYRAAFNRKPDDAGLGFWIYQLDRNLPIETVAKSFVTSPEFVSLYGAAPTHAQVVRALYSNVLHREPDAGGAAFWLERLQQGVPVEVVLQAFSESPENKLQVAAEINAGIKYKRYGE